MSISGLADLPHCYFQLLDNFLPKLPVNLINKIAVFVKPYKSEITEFQCTYKYSNIPKNEFTGVTEIEYSLGGS